MLKTAMASPNLAMFLVGSENPKCAKSSASSSDSKRPIPNEGAADSVLKWFFSGSSGPRWRKSNTEAAEPSWAKLRETGEEPRSAESSTEYEEPDFDMPEAAIAELVRPRLRDDVDEPSCRRSDAKAAEPILARLREGKGGPGNVWSSVGARAPRFTTVKTKGAEPDQAKFRGIGDASRCERSGTATARPRQASDRDNVVEPGAPESSAGVVEPGRVTPVTDMKNPRQPRPCSSVDEPACMESGINTTKPVQAELLNNTVSPNSVRSKAKAEEPTAARL